MDEILCQNCHSSNLVTSFDFESYTTCQDCGMIFEIISNESGNLSYASSESVEFSSFCYRRANHFSEWLLNSQGKESLRISDEELEKVMEVLAQKSIPEDKITHLEVRLALKELGYKKFYEHAIKISSLITGRAPARLTSIQEEQLKIMFLSIQEPFEEFKNSRSNFLSYPFVLHKMCQLLGISHMSNTYSLLKGAAKLHKQDNIWKQICHKLNWKFIPSI